MVKIRLRRVGAKKQPHYRVVVADSHSPRDGKFIEIIGTYNPRTDPPAMEIDAERAVYWLGVGAQPSEAVRRMLDKLGISARAQAAQRAPAAPEVQVPKPEPVTEEEELPLPEDDEDEELDLELAEDDEDEGEEILDDTEDDE
jgi:small subunit ribosomal protein S16